MGPKQDVWGEAENKLRLVNGLLSSLISEGIQIETNTERFQFFSKPRTNAGGPKCSPDALVFVVTGSCKDKYVLGGDNRSFHSRDFRDADDFPGSVGQAGHLDDKVDGGCDLLPTRAVGQIIVSNLDKAPREQLA